MSPGALNQYLAAREKLGPWYSLTSASKTAKGTNDELGLEDARNHAT